MSEVLRVTENKTVLETTMRCATEIASHPPTEQLQIVQAIRMVLFMTGPKAPIPSDISEVLSVQTAALTGLPGPMATLTPQEAARLDEEAPLPPEPDPADHEPPGIPLEGPVELTPVERTAMLLSRLPQGVSSFRLSTRFGCSRTYASRVLRRLCEEGKLDERRPRTRPRVYVLSRAYSREYLARASEGR